MARGPRHYTEMIGCAISVKDYRMLREEMKRRHSTVAEYLRQAAIVPLMRELQQAEVEDGRDV